VTAGHGAATDTPDKQRQRNSRQHDPAHDAEAVHEAKEMCLRTELAIDISDRGCMGICCGDAAPREEAADGPHPLLQ
jgi:hypothetical protein